MLADVVIRACLVGHLEVRGDDVADLAQHGGGTLLPIFLNVFDQFVGTPGLDRLADAGGRQLAADFVAADRLKADRLEDLDAVHHPADRWLPVDRFEDAARADGVMMS